MRQRAEWTFVALMVGALGILPRAVARSAGALIGSLAYAALPRLRQTGLRNLHLAYPELSDLERAAVLKAAYRNLGYQLAEFCLMQHYSFEHAGKLIEFDGLEH